MHTYLRVWDIAIGKLQAAAAELIPGFETAMTKLKQIPLQDCVGTCLELFALSECVIRVQLWITCSALLKCLPLR